MAKRGRKPGQKNGTAVAPRPQIQKVGWWHESIINWMIQNPDKSLAECARAHNVSQSWLSTIIHSDVFQDVFQRRKDMHFANASRSTVEKVAGLADLAVDQLTQRIEQSGDIMPFAQVKDTAEMALKAAGYSASRADSSSRTTNVIQINNGGVRRETLADARQMIQRLHQLPESAEEKGEESVECELLPPAT